MAFSIGERTQPTLATLFDSKPAVYLPFFQTID